MLRAVRFAARLGFEIEAATGDAIRTHAAELKSVSPERVGEDVRKMLAHRARARAAGLAEGHLLDGAVFGARATTAEFLRLRALRESAEWTTAIASWYLDRIAGGVPVPRPDARARAEAVAALRRNLVLSNDETDAIASVLAARESLHAGFAARPLAARKRTMAQAGFDAALDIVGAEAAELASAIASEAARELPERRLPEPLVDGNALLAEGLKAGPAFKMLLDQAMDAQLERRVATRAEALTLVRNLFRTPSGGGA
jgi:poly(A) polymerase